jgi:hypothetical protein
LKQKSGPELTQTQSRMLQFVERNRHFLSEVRRTLIGATDMRTIIIAIAAILVSGCGTDTGDRGLSGAAIGAGIGIIGGPPGMLVGGAIGAGVGIATTPKQIDLGKPAWKG